MIIEVQLDGRGCVRVEVDYNGSTKQIKGLIDHAAHTLNQNPPATSRPIGFGAGSSLDTEVDQCD